MPADQSSEKTITVAPDVEQNLETMSGKVLLTHEIYNSHTYFLLIYSFSFDPNHDNKCNGNRILY